MKSYEEIEDDIEKIKEFNEKLIKMIDLLPLVKEDESLTAVNIEKNLI